MPLRYSRDDPANKCIVQFGPGVWGVLREEPEEEWTVIVLDWNGGGEFGRVPIRSTHGPERLKKFYKK
jgi:hypothetical protein